VRRPGRGSRKPLAIGAAIWVLLAVTLACYLPYQKAQAEKDAITQLDLLDKSIYTPSDATLLAEEYSSWQGHEYASAGVERIYTVSRSCEDIVAEYREAMASSGWTVTPMGNCDSVVWLRMRTSSGAYFAIDACPAEESRLSGEWRLLTDQYEGLYCVLATVFEWYEKP